MSITCGKLGILCIGNHEIYISLTLISPNDGAEDYEKESKTQ